MKFVHRWILCLRIALSPRALVWIRRDAPALLILPGFVFAQVSPIYALFLASGCALFRRWYVVAGVVLGVASSPGALSTSEVQPPAGEHIYLVKILTLDYPRVGELDTIVQVLGSATTTLDDDRVRFDAIKDPYRARLRAIHLPWRNSALLYEGARVVMRAQLRAITDAQRPWSFDAHMARHGIAASGRADLISEPLGDTARAEPLLSDNRYIDEAHGILWSLATGSRNVVSQTTEHTFRRLGLSHVLVFSGFQVMLVGGLVARFVKRISMRCSTRMRGDVIGGIVGFLASLALTGMSGWEPSGLRALLAFGYLLSTGWITGASGSALQRLAVGVVGISLAFPGALFEPGVQLTFAALLGLTCSPLGGWFVPAVAATVFTSFVGLLWFGEWAPIALVFNPIVAPLLTVTGCLLAYPVLVFHELAELCCGGLTIADHAVALLGRVNLMLIQTLAGIVPAEALLKPEAGQLVLTACALGVLIGATIAIATTRYFMGNGVAFRSPIVSI